MPALRLLVVFAATGAALPAVAASEEASPAVEAVNKPGSGPYGEERHAWSPSQVAVVAGGAVTIRNTGTVPHGVQWVSGPATPACGGIPVGTSPSASGIKWSGTCTFVQAGTYIFYCTVHGAEMTGKVTVAANGAVSPPAAASPFAGSASEAVKLASSQHGSRVRGSVAISSAGAGGRLQVDLLASGASLARTGSVAQVRVGRIVRSSLPEGKLSFSVKFNARARSALHRHGRLRLSVKVIVTPSGGSAVTITRHVIMRP